jgi:hypothetical protein
MPEKEGFVKGGSHYECHSVCSEGMKVQSVFEPATEIIKTRPGEEG